MTRLRINEVEQIAIDLAGDLHALSGSKEPYSRDDRGHAATLAVNLHFLRRKIESALKVLPKVD